MLGEQADGQWLQELELANDSVTTLPLAISSRSSANGKLMQTHWVTLLNDFRICDCRIGHVRVQSGGTVITWASTCAASDGLVIPKTGTSEKEVIHGTLTA